MAWFTDLKMGTKLTVDDTLQTAIREIGLALGASRVSASIWAGRRNDGNEAGRALPESCK